MDGGIHRHSATPPLRPAFYTQKSEQWKFQRQFVPPSNKTKGDKDKRIEKVREGGHASKKRLLVRMSRAKFHQVDFHSMILLPQVSDTPVKPVRAASKTPRSSSSGKGVKDTPSRKYESVSRDPFPFFFVQELTRLWSPRLDCAGDAAARRSRSAPSIW